MHWSGLYNCPVIYPNHAKVVPLAFVKLWDTGKMASRSFFSVFYFQEEASWQEPHRSRWTYTKLGFCKKYFARELCGKNFCHGHGSPLQYRNILPTSKFQRNTEWKNIAFSNVTAHPIKWKYDGKIKNHPAVTKGIETNEENTKPNIVPAKFPTQ